METEPGAGEMEKMSCGGGEEEEEGDDSGKIRRERPGDRGFSPVSPRCGKVSSRFGGGDLAGVQHNSKFQRRATAREGD
jgi:hypothetical protein